MSLAERAKNRKRKVEPLNDPDWGDGYFLRRITAAELLTHEAERPEDESDRAGYLAWHAKLIILGVGDANGVKVFSAADVEWLCNEEADLLRRVGTAVRDFNGLSRAAADAEKKSSSSDPSAGSSSSSPAPSTIAAPIGSLNGSPATTSPSGSPSIA